MKKAFYQLSVLLIGLTSVNAQGFEWANSIGGVGEDYGYSITTDALGNVYTTGNFIDTVDFDPGLGVYNLISDGLFNAFVSKLDASGNFVWAKQLGEGGQAFAFSVAIDASGNIYTTGFFKGTADFDPGVGVSNLTSFGLEDIFITKFDSFGNFIWTKQMGGGNAEYSTAVTIDDFGNIYLTGSFKGIADFDPGVGVHSLTSSGNSNIFVSKLDTSGGFVWAKSMGGTADIVGRSIVVDILGNVYTTGYFSNAINFDPGGGSSILVSEGGSDAFVSKLDASGNYVWAKSWGGIGNDYSFSIAQDKFGNLYTTGRFEKTVDFDSGFGTTELTVTPSNNHNTFISKMAASGTFVWVKRLGGQFPNSGNSIIVDEFGSVYVVGEFAFSIEYNTGQLTTTHNAVGSADIFISKLDGFGSINWAKTMGGGAFDRGLSITVDNFGGIYTTGVFYGEGDFNPNSGVFSLTPKGTGDIFIHKMSQSGVGADEVLTPLNSLNIYPNPTTENVIIDFGNSNQFKNQNTQISILNVTGKEVFKQLNITNQKSEISLTGLNKGIYFVKVQSNNQQKVLKLIKQ